MKFYENYHTKSIFIALWFIQYFTKTKMDPKQYQKYPHLKSQLNISYLYFQIRRPRGKQKGYEYGTNNVWDRRHQFNAIGYEHMIVPKAYKNPIEKTYNYGWESKRQYPPLSLQTLQLMIDTGRIDASKPVDLASICNTKVFPLDVSKRHFGVNLTDEGADKFEVSKKGLNYSILLIFLEQFL